MQRATLIFLFFSAGILATGKGGVTGPTIGAVKKQPAVQNPAVKKPVGQKIETKSPVQSIAQKKIIGAGNVVAKHPIVQSLIKSKGQTGKVAVNNQPVKQGQLKPKIIDLAENFLDSNEAPVQSQSTKLGKSKPKPVNLLVNLLESAQEPIVTQSKKQAGGRGTGMTVAAMNKLNIKPLVNGYAARKAAAEKAIQKVVQESEKPADPVDTAFLTRLQTELNPALNVDVRATWPGLRFTREAASDYTVQYKNMTHIAFEIVLQNTTPNPNPKFEKPKPKTELYDKFFKMVQVFSRFLIVNPEDYEPYVRTLGVADEPKKVEIIGHNLDVYVRRPKPTSEFPQMRFFIRKDFMIPFPKELKVPAPSEPKLGQKEVKGPVLTPVFEGPRLGLMGFDGEVQTIWDKCFPPIDDPKKPQRVAECRSSFGAYKNVPFNLHFKVENSLYIFEMQINENDPQQLLNERLELLRKQQELIMSKKLLRSLGLIGFYNDQDGAFVNFKLDKPKSQTYVTVQYLTLFRSVEMFTSNRPQKFARIIKKCNRITNQVITWDMLGVHTPNKTIVKPEFKLEAFETGDSINYVFVYKDFPVYKHRDDELWDEVFTAVDFSTCSYHDDDYFIGMKLNEMYLITFSVPKEADLKI